MASMKNKGKRLESSIRKEFENLLVSRGFAYYRCPDARACMGRIKKQPGDFFFFTKTDTYLIEVKEVKHDFRIPKKRITQLPKMRLFALTCVKPFVIIKHTQTESYRVMDFEFMTENFYSNEASYNLSALTLFNTLAEALNYVICC